MRSVLFAPHADDETLFAAYTILRHRPAIVICYPSVRDYGETGVRLAESRAAMRILGAPSVTQWDGQALEAQMRALDAAQRPAIVWAPADGASHPDHVAVATAARAVFGERLRRYHTYDVGGKVAQGAAVPCDPSWPERKRRALACYHTQRTHPRARVFFDETVYGLDEFGDDAPAGVVPTPPIDDRDAVRTPEDQLADPAPAGIARPMPSPVTRRPGDATVTRAPKATKKAAT